MSDTNDTRRRTAMRRTMTLGPDDVLTINLPGLLAVRIDMIDRVIAVDGISGTYDGPGNWTVHDLHKKGLGDFHRLNDPATCSGIDCSPKEHVKP